MMLIVYLRGPVQQLPKVATSAATSNLPLNTHLLYKVCTVLKQTGLDEVKKPVLTTQARII